MLLILYLHALHEFYTQPRRTNNASNKPGYGQGQIPETLRSVYIVSRHPFTAVEDFVDSSVQRYHLDLSRYAKSMKEAFADYLQDQPNVKAIFVGTRRTDPHGGQLTHFDQTDRGWPNFMRIHPVIDWHYAEIWTFIRELGIPYCSLYDLGYTSLGGTTDTHPNPALKYSDVGGPEEVADGPGDPDSGQGSLPKYRPAYELIEDYEERLGRDGGIAEREGERPKVKDGVKVSWE